MRFDTSLFEKNDPNLQRKLKKYQFILRVYMIKNCHGLRQST